MPAPSDTLIKFGDPLTNSDSPQLQPGWTVEQDGFGLVQVQAKYKWDISRANYFLSKFEKGVFQAPDPFTYCTMWKANMSVDKGGILTITADFVGIDTLINSGARTNPQIAATAGSSSEAIEHHPNFVKENCTSGSLPAGAPLAPWPTGNGWDGASATNPNRALWTPYVAARGAEQGYQFVGFLPNQKSTEPINIKAGVKNYYKPQLTLRVLQYILEESEALEMASYVGWTNTGQIWNVPEAYRNLGVPGSYPGVFTYSSEYAAKINPGFLCTNCSVELYGAIYKVTTDLMLSGIAGWDPDIYPAVTD
jgi:hypothetical protein